MTFKERPDGRFDFIAPDPSKIRAPRRDSIVKAGDELLELCQMCIKSRLTCDNKLNRDVEVPMEADDDPALEVIGYLKQDDGTFIEERLGTKAVDGFKAGIYKTEADIPIPFVCKWFEPKDLG